MEKRTNSNKNAITNQKKKKLHERKLKSVTKEKKKKPHEIALWRGFTRKIPMRQEEGKGRKRKHQHQKNRKPTRNETKMKTTKRNHKTQEEETREIAFGVSAKKAKKREAYSQRKLFIHP